nr:armadillo [Tanacetum cinerariifolium]
MGFLTRKGAFGWAELAQGCVCLYTIFRGVCLCGLAVTAGSIWLIETAVGVWIAVHSNGAFGFGVFSTGVTRPLTHIPLRSILEVLQADIKAIGDSSSTDQETTNNSDWTNDDLSKADGLSSIHDNTIDKNPSCTSHHQNSHFSVHDTHPNKSEANHHHTSVLPVKESTVQKSALKKPSGSRRHTSVSTGDKSGVYDITINKSGVDHHTLNTIMSDSEDSTVTYTTVSSPYEGRLGDVSPGEDRPPVMPEDPYAYVVAAFQALPPPDYVPGPEEPEQAPPSPVYIPYVPELVYLEYIPPEDNVFSAEEQPLPAAASPTADSPGYILESDSDEDPEGDDDEDPEEDLADYLANHDDDDDKEEPSGDDADEEDKEQDEDDDDEEEEHPASADSIPPPPALPSPPILPIPLHAASPPLQLLSSDRRADTPEVTLTPRKRLSIVHCPGYEAGESSAAAAARPIEGRRADYGFVNSVKAEIRRRRAEDIGYGIRDTWIYPRDVAEEVALTTLEGVNTRVTELAAVQ